MRPTRADAARDSAGGSGSEVSDDAYLNRRRGQENFPVALRLLPGEVRTHLRRLYDVARVIDDLGDAADGDRTAALQAFRADLETIWAGGTPQAPVLRQLAASVAAAGLSRQPFVDLIEANLRDQTTTAYATYADLVGYCALSADPVGRLVLEIFDARTPDRDELSDQICTALQIVEHCQDIAEDQRAGRTYLPQEDLDRFGVAPADLDGATAGPQLRLLIGFQAERAGTLLAAGTPLLGQLSGWARVAVAGYVAGGRAAIAALRRAGWSPLPAPPPTRRVDVLRAFTRLWAGAA